MLESRALLVRPTLSSRTNRSSGRVADIFEIPTGRLLGIVHRDAPEPWWRRWLLPPALTVHEADEEPLLFILQRRWRYSGFWNVLDADEQLIGSLRRFTPLPRVETPLRGPSIRDQDGHFLAALQIPSATTDEGCIIDPHGARLATVRAAANETELAFHLAADGGPWLRMLLLAAILQPLDG